MIHLSISLSQYHDCTEQKSVNLYAVSIKEFTLNTIFFFFVLII